MVAGRDHPKINLATLQPSRQEQPNQRKERQAGFCLIANLPWRRLLLLCGNMEDREIRAALERHWAASDANDFEAEHEIYREDAVLEYPQSGERIRGRRNIQASRFAQPNKKRFTVRRILGAGDLWISEFVLTYDGKPSYTVSIMEFRDGKVARETQYFGDPFEPGPSRAQWVERMS
jgi:ketosteroid isomerase-like protein